MSVIKTVYFQNIVIPVLGNSSEQIILKFQTKKLISCGHGESETNGDLIYQIETFEVRLFTE